MSRARGQLGCTGPSSELQHKSLGIWSANQEPPPSTACSPSEGCEAGWQGERRAGVSHCGTRRGKAAMPGCRRACVKPEKPKRQHQGRDKPWCNYMCNRSHSAARSGARHRSFPGCLCLRCRFRTMGTLRVTVQSLQKPVVKTSKGSYKK